MKSGQVQVVTVILISGVLISLVGVAYIWGVPLINKQSSAITYTTASTFVLDLNNQIIDTANTGAGGGSMELPLGSATVKPFDSQDQENNSIIIEVTVPQALALSEGEVYLGGATFSDVNNPVGTVGESNPSIVTFKLEPLGNQYIGKFKIHFRELKDPPNRYLIVLNQGSTQELRGTSKISWSFGQTFDTPEGITMTNIIVSVE